MGKQSELGNAYLQMEVVSWTRYFRPDGVSGDKSLR
jgi:hypothetical protein